MSKIQKGYSPRMADVRKALRQMGLPEGMFDADFEEHEAQNKLDHAVLLERMREKERNGEYEGLDLPWTEQRKRFEEDVANGIEYDFVATQNKTPRWLHSMQTTIGNIKGQTAERVRAIERQEKKKKGQ